MRLRQALASGINNSSGGCGDGYRLCGTNLVSERSTFERRLVCNLCQQWTKRGPAHGLEQPVDPVDAEFCWPAIAKSWSIRLSARKMQ